MKIIVDSAEKCNMNILKVLNERGIPWTVRKLKYCDYSFEIDGVSYEKKCAVEKKGLTEIAGNFSSGRDKFDREFCKGKIDNCEMTLLIEDPNVRDKIKTRILMDEAGIDLQTKFRKTWRSKFSGNSMKGSIKAFKDRYNLELIFCKKVETADKILKVFEEYLENNYVEANDNV